MPRDGKTRHKVRRKLEAAATLCNNINQHLAEAAQPYEGPRPDIHLAMMNIGQIIEYCKGELMSLRSKI